jgi:sigma-B regulation protein RsbU (phosphoserine phosphatase)
MDAQTIRVLLIEDNPGDAGLIRACLHDVGRESIRLDHAQRLSDGIARLQADKPDVLLLDLTLPDSSGIDTLRRVVRSDDETPIVVLTGVAGDALAMRAVQEGAQDYLVKGEFDGDALVRSILYALERSRRHRAEASLLETEHSLRIAREIQLLLFPPTAPQLDGFDIAGATTAAEGVDGDYFDYLPLNDGSLAITIGDACGHGLPAALLSARTHACLRTLSITYTDVCEILRLANRVLTSGMSANRFVTLLMTSIEPATRTLSWANAGHPSGFVIDADGRVRAELRSSGYPLGVEANTVYGAHPTLDLAPGEIVVMLTDGIAEAKSKSGEPFGARRTLELVRDCRKRSAADIINAIQAAASGFCQAPHFEDDITAVVAKCV